MKDRGHKFIISQEAWEEALEETNAEEEKTNTKEAIIKETSKIGKKKEHIVCDAESIVV